MDVAGDVTPSWPRGRIWQKAAVVSPGGHEMFGEYETGDLLIVSIGRECDYEPDSPVHLSWSG